MIMYLICPFLFPIPYSLILKTLTAAACAASSPPNSLKWSRPSNAKLKKMLFHMYIRCLQQQQQHRNRSHDQSCDLLWLVPWVERGEHAIYSSHSSTSWSLDEVRMNLWKIKLIKKTEVSYQCWNREASVHWTWQQLNMPTFRPDASVILKMV